jgi:hypothetical protein
MQVLNAQLAFLDVDLLLLAVAAVIHGALPLVGRVVGHDEVVMGASSYAVGGSRQSGRGGRGGHGGCHA